LNTTKHISILEQLKIKKNNLKEKLINNDSLISKHKEDNIRLYEEQKKFETISRELTDEIIEIKSRTISLKNKLDECNDIDSDMIVDIKDKGNKLIKQKKIKEDRLSLLRDENETLNNLKDILSENGIRKQIISSLVKPINDILSDMLDKINYPYRVILNDEFDALIYDKGNLLFSEIMSNGELKILNLCIALSYIQMVRKNNNINILFMDEVFQSIHRENINIMLDLLKIFSKENKLNIILVHHGLEEVDPNIFDKIISVEKDMFSDIKITDNKCLI